MHEKQITISYHEAFADLLPAFRNPFLSATGSLLGVRETRRIVGDYVLSGGELPAMVLMDAVIRLLPGVLGHADSAQQDSYADGLLDCPHYTRPEEIDGRGVPEVLLSGDHERIRRWRLKQALGRTWLRRPDLLEDRELSAEERLLLDEYIRAHQGT